LKKLFFHQYMNVREINRFVFFKCHDCDRAFWKKALLPPREHMIQHTCVGNKTSTRVFGLSARTCTHNHPNSTCVEKISQEEYSSQPNCGSWERYLTGAKLQRKVKRKRLSSPHDSVDKRVRKKAGKSAKVLKSKKIKPNSNRQKEMKQAVKQILRENKIAHRRKKQNWPIKRPTSVWDPGHCDDSWNELPHEHDKGLDDQVDVDVLFHKFMKPTSFGLCHLNNENMTDAHDSGTSDFSTREMISPIVPLEDWSLDNMNGLDYLNDAEVKESTKGHSTEEDIAGQSTSQIDIQDLQDERLPMWENSPLTSSLVAADSFEIHPAFSGAQDIDKLLRSPTSLDDCEKHLESQTSSAQKSYLENPLNPMLSVVNDLTKLPIGKVLSMLDECEKDTDSSEPVLVNDFESKAEFRLKSLDYEPEIEKEVRKENLLTGDEKDILTYIDGLIDNID